jgi:hypothetical protein
LKKGTKKLLVPQTVPFDPAVANGTTEGKKSFFASFCAQKEVLTFLP